MRVSESLVHRRMLSNNSAARSRLDEAMLPLMTGQQLNRPSEDPMHAQRIERARRGQRSSERYTESISRLEGYHQMVDSTSASVVDTLTELSTLSVQMSNDSIDGDQRAIAADHVGNLIDQLRSLGNASYNGRHLFSGRLENTAPYGESLAYEGDTSEREVAVSGGVSVKSDVLGTAVFGDPSNGELTAFAAAQALQTALENDDGDAIAAALDGIKDTHQRAVAARSRAGTVLNDLNKIRLHHDELNFTYKTEENDLVSADIAVAASELAFAEQVYQASLATSSRISELFGAELRL